MSEPKNVDLNLEDDEPQGEDEPLSENQRTKHAESIKQRISFVFETVTDLDLTKN